MGRVKRKSNRKNSEASVEKDQNRYNKATVNCFWNFGPGKTYKGSEASVEKDQNIYHKTTVKVNLFY